MKTPSLGDVRKAFANTQPVAPSGRVLVGCSDRMGCKGMSPEEYGPAAFEVADIASPADALSHAVQFAMRMNANDDVRITVLSAFHLTNPVADRASALAMSFGSFSHPSAGPGIVDRVAWVPVAPNTPHDQLAAGIKAEVEHLAGRNSDIAGSDSADVSWFLFMWPVEGFGFTAASGARFLAESAFGMPTILPDPLPVTPRRRRTA